MDNNEQAIEKLQWHPAFYAGLQIELQEDSDNLIFENEHQLGTKPKQIDALIIKKQKDIPVKKNMGKIFRGHNIVEYKSPTDYLCIDDYYKGYAYAMFYKSDTQKVDEIPISDITLTFVSTKYPQKFVEHLKTKWNYKFEQKYQGICDVVYQVSLGSKSFAPDTTELVLENGDYDLAVLQENLPYLHEVTSVQLKKTDGNPYP